MALTVGLRIEIAVVRPHGFTANISGEYDVNIKGNTVYVDRKARALSQRARRLQEREDGMPVVTIYENVVNPVRIEGVAGEFKFRTRRV